MTHFTYHLMYFGLSIERFGLWDEKKVLNSFFTD